MENRTPVLNLPAAELKVDENMIFDPVRKKWVTLTPEEWVRQNFIAYLIDSRKYPKSLIKIEASINAFNKARRCDAIIYTREVSPLVIIEFKAPDIEINEKTFKQIAFYNSSLNVPFLILSNGLDHYFCEVNPVNKTCKFWDHIPLYQEINSLI